MLYNVEITNDIASDENKLCERLYLFLNSYVDSKLRYQDKATREDYIQDTIMYLVKHFRRLTEDQKKEINLERFFYNKANSFIGSKLRRENIKNELLEKYKREVLYIEVMDKASREVEYIDMVLLNKIIDKYSLSKEKADILKKLSVNKLVILGYYGDFYKIDDSLDPNKIFDSLSYSVADEYLLEIVKEKVDVR